MINLQEIALASSLGKILSKDGTTERALIRKDRRKRLGASAFELRLRIAELTPTKAPKLELWKPQRLKHRATPKMTRKGKVKVRR